MKILTTMALYYRSYDNTCIQAITTATNLPQTGKVFYFSYFPLTLGPVLCKYKKVNSCVKQ